MPLPAALAFLGNPSFYAGATGLVSGLGGALKGGSGSDGGAGVTSVNVTQNVGQNQSTNIGSNVGSQRDVADQLGFLLGAPSVATLPPTIGGDSAHIQDLYKTVLNQSPPVTGGIGDSRYSPLTGGVAKKPGIHINQILIYVGIGLVILLIVKKKRR